MKIPGGILLSPATCAAIGPGLQDFLAGWHVNGLQAPEYVRLEGAGVADWGRRFQAASLAKRAPDVRQDVRSLANRRSSPAISDAVTYSTAQAAKKLGIGPRAAQRRAERGSLRATRVRGELRFAKDQIDRLAKGIA